MGQWRRGGGDALLGFWRESVRLRLPALAPASAAVFLEDFREEMSSTSLKLSSESASSDIYIVRGCYYNGGVGLPRGAAIEASWA